MIKAVIIGCAHMHINEVALYIYNQPDMELAAFADIPPASPELPKTRYTRAWNADNVRNNYCKTFYSDYRNMLDEIRPDIAFILSETAEKPEISAECVKRGVDISVEKPMAMTFDEALAIKQSADKNGVELMVNWPLTWRPYLHRMKAALDDGIIGRLIKIRFLIGNTGPVGRGATHRGVNTIAEEMTDAEKASMWWYQKNRGGGALLDFCSYGCMLSRWITGEKAVSATAEAGNFATGFADVYDNAAVILKYPSLLAILEGTWTTPSAAIPAGPVLFGTDGVLYCEKRENRIDVRAVDIYGRALEVPEMNCPPHLTNIAEMYAYAKQTGKPIHETLRPDFNLDVMAILDAAQNSVQSGKREEVRKL